MGKNAKKNFKKIETFSSRCPLFLRKLRQDIFISNILGLSWVQFAVKWFSQTWKTSVRVGDFLNSLFRIQNTDLRWSGHHTFNHGQKSFTSLFPWCKLILLSPAVKGSLPLENDKHPRGVLRNCWLGVGEWGVTTDEKRRFHSNTKCYCYFESVSFVELSQHFCPWFLIWSNNTEKVTRTGASDS